MRLKEVTTEANKFFKNQAQKNMVNLAIYHGTQAVVLQGSESLGQHVTSMTQSPVVVKLVQSMPELYAALGDDRLLREVVTNHNNMLDFLQSLDKIIVSQKQHSHSVPIVIDFCKRFLGNQVKTNGAEIGASFDDGGDPKKHSLVSQFNAVVVLILQSFLKPLNKMASTEAPQKFAVGHRAPRGVDKSCNLYVAEKFVLTFESEGEKLSYMSRSGLSPEQNITLELDRRVHTLVKLAVENGIDFSTVQQALHAALSNPRSKYCLLLYVISLFSFSR